MEMPDSMPLTLLPFARPVSASEVLDAGFRLFRGTLARCLPWSMLSVLAGQAPRALEMLREGVAAPPSQKDALWWIATLVGGVLNLLLFQLMLLRQQAVAYGVARSLRAEMATVLRGSPGSLLMNLLWSLPFIVLGAAAGATAWGVVLLVALPALWSGVGGMFCNYLRLLDAQAPLAALRGSFRLIAGHWWRTAGVLAVALVILLVLYALGGVAAVVLTQLLAAADVALLSVITTVLVVVVAAVFLPLLVALGHTLFADLRLRRLAKTGGA